jgi:hypothetical protein
MPFLHVIKVWILARTGRFHRKNRAPKRTKTAQCGEFLNGKSRGGRPVVDPHKTFAASGKTKDRIFIL